MPKKKGVRVTKQIRAYETSVDFLEELVSRSPEGTTYAEALEQALKKAYPELFEEVVKAKGQARSVIDRIFETKKR